VTLMVVPERTRRVYRLAVPFFLVKLSAILVSLCVVFLVIIGMDYVHVLRGMAENKALKGENFKLRREIQLIRNKVDSMESTIERVRNYAKKLQLLTGQGDKEGGTMPWEGSSGAEVPRSPAAKPPKSSRFYDPLEPGASTPIPQDTVSLIDRVDGLKNASVTAEYHLTSCRYTCWLKALSLRRPRRSCPSTAGYRRHLDTGATPMTAPTGYTRAWTSRPNRELRCAPLRWVGSSTPAIVRDTGRSSSSIMVTASGLFSPTTRSSTLPRGRK